MRENVVLTQDNVPKIIDFALSIEGEVIRGGARRGSLERACLRFSGEQRITAASKQIYGRVWGDVVRDAGGCTAV
jgi:hypothetical protein